MHEYVSESDPALRYRFEADDSGTLLISLVYAEESGGTFRLPRVTALGIIGALRDFVEESASDEEHVTATPLEPADHLRAEARIVRSVRHELAMQVCVAAGLTMDLRLGVRGAQHLLDGLLAVVPLRQDDRLGRRRLAPVPPLDETGDAQPATATAG